MSYKFGFILSLVFVAMFFIFGIDMINLQFMYQDIDSKALSIGYLIAKQGNLSQIPELETRFDVKIQCLSDPTPMFGDVVKFKVQDNFKPMIISSDVMTLSVIRTTVIGFYQ